MNNRSSLFYIFLIIWPFIFLFPLTSGFIAMGNDFDLIYYSYKKYIFEFWQEGQIPFWSPSEGAGFSLIYNPFAQFFYPPSWILYFFCDLKNSFSLYDYLIYTIFGISIYSIGQYQWLKSIKFSNNKVKYVVTLLVPTTLILTNFLRLPNAIQTICWLPYLLLGINYTLNKKKYIKSFCLLFLSTFFIFTAGYPYFIFYIFIFTILYFFFILNFYNIKISEYFHIFLKNLFPVTISFLFSFPWLYGVLKILKIAQDRDLNDYNYSTKGGFEFLDIIGSWFYPVISNTEGRYYFGIAITFLIIKFFLDLQYKVFKIGNKEKKLIYFCILSFLIVTFFSASESKIFQFFWNRIEFIQNIRTWPRINILMIPLLCILITIALDYFAKIFDNKEKENINLSYNLVSSNILLFFILTVQLYFFFSQNFHEYWFVWHEKRFLFASQVLSYPLNQLVMYADGRINILATVIFLGFTNYLLIYKNKFKVKYNLLFIGILFIISFEQFLNSNLQWSLKDWKTSGTYNNYYAIDKLKKNFNKPRIKTNVHGNNYFRDDSFSINNFLNWGNKKHNLIFWSYYNKEGLKENNLNHIETLRLETFFGLNEKNKKIFFTKNLDQKNIIKFVEDSENYEKKNINNYYISDFSNNNITINFYSKSDGYLSYIDNMDPFWHAYVNENEKKILKLMNTYKSLNFKKGKNTVKFKYEPFRY